MPPYILVSHLLILLCFSFWCVFWDQIFLIVLEALSKLLSRTPSLEDFEVC